MTPEELDRAAAQAADLASVLDAHGLGRLGTDAACVASRALQSLTHLLSKEEDVSDTPRDLGAARFPGVRPEALYSNPTPIASTADECANPFLVRLTDGRPGKDNGPAGMSWLVVPSRRLAQVIEDTGGAPMRSDAGRPRQCSLRLWTMGDDEVLTLVVRFTPHLLTVWRPGEPDQPTAGTTIPLKVQYPGCRADSGRGRPLGEVRAVYPTWPRLYRVLDLTAHDLPYFARFHTVTLDGSPSESSHD